MSDRKPTGNFVKQCPHCQASVNLKLDAAIDLEQPLGGTYENLAICSNNTCGKPFGFSAQFRNGSWSVSNVYPLDDFNQYVDTRSNISVNESEVEELKNKISTYESNIKVYQSQIKKLEAIDSSQPGIEAYKNRINELEIELEGFNESFSKTTKVIKQLRAKIKSEKKTWDISESLKDFDPSVSSWKEYKKQHDHKWEEIIPQDVESAKKDLESLINQVLNSDLGENLTKELLNSPERINRLISNYDNSIKKYEPLLEQSLPDSQKETIESTLKQLKSFNNDLKAIKGKVKILYNYDEESINNQVDCLTDKIEELKSDLNIKASSELTKYESITKSLLDEKLTKFNALLSDLKEVQGYVDLIEFISGPSFQMYLMDWDDKKDLSDYKEKYQLSDIEQDINTFVNLNDLSDNFDFSLYDDLVSFLKESTFNRVKKIEIPGDNIKEVFNSLTKIIAKLESVKDEKYTDFKNNLTKHVIKSHLEKISSNGFGYSESELINYFKQELRNDFSSSDLQPLINEWFAVNESVGLNLINDYSTDLELLLKKQDMVPKLRKLKSKVKKRDGYELIDLKDFKQTMLFFNDLSNQSVLDDASHELNKKLVRKMLKEEELIGDWRVLVPQSKSYSEYLESKLQEEANESLTTFDSLSGLITDYVQTESKLNFKGFKEKYKEDLIKYDLSGSLKKHVKTEIKFQKEKHDQSFLDRLKTGLAVGYAKNAKRVNLVKNALMFAVTGSTFYLTFAEQPKGFYWKYVDSQARFNALESIAVTSTANLEEGGGLNDLNLADLSEAEKTFYRNRFGELPGEDLDGDGVTGESYADLDGDDLPDVGYEGIREQAYALESYEYDDGTISNYEQSYQNGNIRQVHDLVNSYEAVFLDVDDGDFGTEGIDETRLFSDPTYEYYIGNEELADGSDNPFWIDAEHWNEEQQQGLEELQDHYQAEAYRSRADELEAQSGGFLTAAKYHLLNLASRNKTLMITLAALGVGVPTIYYGGKKLINKLKGDPLSLHEAYALTEFSPDYGEDYKKIAFSAN